MRLNSKIYAFQYVDEHEWCFVDSAGEVVYEVDDGIWLEEFNTENEALSTLHQYKDEVRSERFAHIHSEIRKAKLPRIHKPFVCFVV